MTGYGNNNWNPHSMHSHHQKQAIRRDSNFVGLISIAQVILLQVISVVLILGLSSIGIADPTDSRYFGLGNTGFLLFYSIIYIVAVGLPAPIIALIARRRISPFSDLEQASHKEPGFLQVALALMAGLSLCIIANYITSYIVYFLNEIGLRPPDMPVYVENSVVSLLLNMFTLALLPAVLEEMVYRGYILRTLLPHGKMFAIVVSSAMFALMHGNLLQIPFAFIVGLTCGYLAVKTGKIWVAALLHFLNNFMAVVLQYAGINLTDSQTQKVVAIAFSILGIIGLYSLIALFAAGDPGIREDKDRQQPAPAVNKTGALLSAPAIIAYLVVSVILIVLTTRFGG